MVKKVYETDEPAMIVNAFDRQRQAALPAPKPRQITGITITERRLQSLRPCRLKQPRSSNPQSAAAALRKKPLKPNRLGRLLCASAAPSTPQQSPPAPRNNGGGFGMEAAQAPPDNIQEALTRAFMK